MDFIEVDVTDLVTSICGKEEDKQQKMIFQALDDSKDIFVFMPPCQATTGLKMDILQEWGIQLQTVRATELPSCDNQSHGTHAFSVAIFFDNNQMKSHFDKPENLINATTADVAILEIYTRRSWMAFTQVTVPTGTQCFTVLVFHLQKIQLMMRWIGIPDYFTV